MDYLGSSLNLPGILVYTLDKKPKNISNHPQLRRYVAI
ncbi:hypothetical protein [Methylomonas fluvii]|nr:hypothetical protein [Methylomonas fluvii]